MLALASARKIADLYLIGTEFTKYLYEPPGSFLFIFLFFLYIKYIKKKESCDWKERQFLEIADLYFIGTEFTKYLYEPPGEYKQPQA